MSIKIETTGKCRIEGVEYPAIGFGTYPYKNEICQQAVKAAATLGYRIIDTATFYENFEPIAQALKTFDRHTFYLISKVWPDSQTPEKLKIDFERTLKQLQTSYLDAYLIHWPNSKIPIQETLHAMNALKIEGKLHQIGMSNVTVAHLRRALEVGVPISWVQVEMHPLFYDPELLDFCQAHSIVVQAWGPLGRGRLHDDALLTKIGAKYGKTASQVALRWIFQHGSLPLPGSKNRAHIEQNMDIWNFALSPEEMSEINARAKEGKRERVTADMGVGFTDEFDFTYEECWPQTKGATQ
jgi:2,5-diketo-D-gluconate reductase B